MCPMQPIASLTTSAEALALLRLNPAQGCAESLHACAGQRMVALAQASALLQVAAARVQLAARLEEPPPLQLRLFPLVPFQEVPPEPERDFARGLRGHAKVPH